MESDPEKSYADVGRLKCNELAADSQRAAIGEGVKQFIRSITLTFGISFSALLAALYVPAALRLQAMAATASGIAIHTSEDARHKRLRTLGLESDLLAKAVTVIATLSPLFASLISNALGAAK